MLKNTVLKVKGVPMFYLPVMYYPITGTIARPASCCPIYGSSIIRGQSISNAFFWAINRSQDATVLHDWFTRPGQGYGAEYRYVARPGSQGNVQDLLPEGEGERRIEQRARRRRRRRPRLRGPHQRRAGAAAQPSARGNVDYFSAS